MLIETQANVMDKFLKGLMVPKKVKKVREVKEVKEEEDQENGDAVEDEESQYGK